MINGNKSDDTAFYAFNAFSQQIFKVLFLQKCCLILKGF